MKGGGVGRVFLEGVFGRGRRGVWRREGVEGGEGEGGWRGRGGFVKCYLRVCDLFFDLLSYMTTLTLVVLPVFVSLLY